MSEQSKPRRAILVLGMHRSGTSALTRVLALCGAALPRHLMPAHAKVNALGFWESQSIVDLHDEALHAAGSVWHDIRPIADSWFATPAALGFADRLAALLVEEYGDAPLIVMKDPRLCRLLPLWLVVFERLEIAPLVVIPVRHPLEVVASLREREGFGEVKWLLLWLEHWIAAERASRGLPRSFVTYDDLLVDWRSMMARIGTALGISWGSALENASPAIEAFLTATLRHHNSDDTATVHPAVANWVDEAYNWALTAARGAAPDGGALDRLSAAIGAIHPAAMAVIGELEAELERSRAEQRRWTGVAEERYELIEHLQAELARSRDVVPSESPSRRPGVLSRLWLRARHPVR